MTLQERRLAILGSVILIIASMIYGATRKPHIAFPRFTEVKSIRMPDYFTAPHPAPRRPDPKPVVNVPQNRAIVEKALSLLSNAQPVGYARNPTSIILGASALFSLNN